MDDGRRADGPNYALRFGAVLFGAAVVLTAADYVAGIPGLLVGVGVVSGTGAVLGSRVDRAFEQTVSNIESTIGASELTVADGEIRGLDAALEDQVEENRRLRERVDDLEAELAETEQRNERIETQTEQFREAMQLCAGGQLAHRIEIDDETPLDVGDDFNDMMDELEGTVRHLKDFIALVVSSSDEVLSGTEEVSEASDQISDAIQEIAEGATVQSERLQSVTHEMETLSSSIEEIAALSNDVTTLSERTADAGREGQEAAKTAIDGLNEMEDGSAEAVDAIESLRTEMEAIDELVEFISEVARKTNMLALNANIEASRNTSGSRSEDGFAAVAKEVKELAAETKEAADDIEKRIEDIHAQTEVATETVRETEERVAVHTDSIENALDALAEIAEYAEETNRGVQEIHTAANQQAESAQQVVALVDETASISEQTSDLAEEVTASAEEQTAALTDVSSSAKRLSENANWLHDTLDMYKARHDPPDTDRLSSAERTDAAAEADAGSMPTWTTGEPSSWPELSSSSSSASDSERERSSADRTADTGAATGTRSASAIEPAERSSGTTDDAAALPTQFQTGLATGEDSFLVGHRAATRAFTAMDTDRVDFCQVFCSPAYDYEDVLRGIRDVIGDEAKLIGATSAGEFTERTVSDGSVAVSLVASDTIEFFTGLGTAVSEGAADAVNEAVAELPSSVEGYPHLAAINLHDGLAGISDQIALVTQRDLGHDVSFVGGSASDDLTMNATHVFHDETVTTDSVVIALVASKEPVTITVGHGHSPISEPMTVTKSEGGRVIELDGKPAFEAWREAVESHLDGTDRTIDVDAIEGDSEELLELLTEFEFGIEEGHGAISGGYKIRWPGLTRSKAGPLEFPVGVPEGTVLRVMHSPPDEQIVSARETAEAAARNASGEVAGGFVYDCACRSIILGDEFDDAVDAMSEVLDVPFSGFETYGELCMERGQMSGYHNTSSVIMLLPT
ncbi:FIST N-terminal domain-containing protein [Natrinema salaciae]|uniref:Methyl-accepting chemotaxis protein n=1 Tax=Natrinema salaciae TaxID=1186196 RepID=A0A1H9FX65_9EURY|nr:FIST N-terminal domain-containing protein [Natrinema salaciae]SEQ42437.1 methyl-accepting chemotaxis protein [Natrinema salaciae]